MNIQYHRVRVMRSNRIIDYAVLSLVRCICAVMVCLIAIPAQAEPSIDVIATLNQRPGNPAVTPDGTVYVSMHPFDNPEYKIMRIEKDGVVTPYPTARLSKHYEAVIGIQATQDSTLWWLDMGSETVSPKLVGWNTRSNTLKAVHVIPREASVANSFHQDFAIDEKRGKAFIADMSRGNLIDVSEPAIVVIDLKTGTTRRILQGHATFQPGDTVLTAEGKAMQMSDDSGKPHDIKLGLNPIAIDPEFEWVYFSTMTAGKLHRIRAEMLGDASKTEAELAEAIEVYTDKPSSDGIAAGDNGIVYITNVDNSSIDIADGTGIHNWINDARLIWPDGLYVAPDKSVIATINQLNRAAVFNKGTSRAAPPYLVVQISEQ